MHLDVFTMSVMITITALTMAASLLWVSRRHNHHGLKLCASGLVLYAFSLPVLALRNTLLPETLSIVAGNLMVSASLAMLLLAVYRFYGQKPNPWLILPPLVFLTPGLMLGLDTLSHRVIFASFIFTVQHAALGWITLKYRPNHAGDGYLMAAAAPFTCAAVLVLRALLEFAGINNMPYYTTSELRYNYFILASLGAVIVFTLGFIFMARDAVENNYRQLSISDELTGMPNRRHLLNQLRERLAEASRIRTHLTLLMIDIDRFKDINDNLGHLVGAEVLKQVARTINSRIRINDLAGRYGGEEFLVILPHTAPHTAALVAEDLRKSIESLTIRFGGVRISVTVSIGVCSSQPDAPLTLDALLGGADKAMYLAKDQNRNRVVIEQV